MAHLASARAIDLVLLLLVAEAVWLARRRPAPAVVRALLPGALLVLALRACAAGWPWRAIALALAAALPANPAGPAARGWLRR